MANLSNTLSDLELLRRMAAGDAAALTEVHRRYHRVAYATAARALHDPGLSQDATQEAFLDLWRGAAKFDPARAKLSTWVVVLAHRRAVDIARREARRQIDAYDDSLSPADAYTTEERVIIREDQRIVRAALRNLHARERTIVELAYYGGLTHTQIAHQLDIPLGTAKSRMFKALATLHELLAAPPGPQTARA
jgi:RNA polymerase sigma factor (sigma-70 family)